MKITYIYHSGFLVEMEHVAILFDYYKGIMPKVDTKKPFLSFTSHEHEDHFGKEIFYLWERYDNAFYIFSDDVHYKIPRIIRNKVRFMAVNDYFDIRLPEGEVSIETLESTDEGVAFLIRTDGKVIYHAGDLNWWSWVGEPESFSKDMKKRFQNEIEKLAGMKIDVAFLPLDPRQKDDRFWWGFDYFMRKTDTTYAFPMHFWSEHSVIDKLIEMETSQPYRDRICEINGRGHTYTIL